MEGNSIIQFVEDVKMVTGISKKTGNPYEYIQIVFRGGYTVPLFLNSDQMYILKNVSCKG